MDIIKQALKFFGISGIGWIIDFALFNVLFSINKNELISNIISSFVAVTFVFFVSTRATFARKQTRIPLQFKYIVYIVYQVLLIYIASFYLKEISEFWKLNHFILSHYSHVIAKILVTPVTMILNFIVMKLLIERI